MIIKSLGDIQVSIREVFYKVFQVSYIKHIYRSHIKANVISLIHKYSFTKDFLKRFQDYRDTKKRYKGLKNLISFKVKTKKIIRAWEIKNYSLFFKLSFLFVFAVPIKLYNKVKNVYVWLQPFVKSSFKSIRKLFNLINVDKK